MLIAPSTSAHWEPETKNAAAIVTDHYGRTSHAAIVVRLPPKTDDCCSVRAAVAAALDPAGLGEFVVEYPVRGIVDGVERVVSARARVDFADGQPRRMLGTVADVTAHRRAEAILARDKSELEALVAERTRDLEETQAKLAHAQRMEALRQLAGGIAHNFNNVLQAVQGSAELIGRRPETPDSPEVVPTPKLGTESRPETQWREHGGPAAGAHRPEPARRGRAGMEESAWSGSRSDAPLLGSAWPCVRGRGYLAEGYPQGARRGGRKA